METMDWKVEIKLVGPEGTQRDELFLGRDAHDLAMLAAAKGWLEGLYKSAEPASLLSGFEGMAEMVQKILNPRPGPGPGPVMAELSTPTRLVETQLGLLEITGQSEEAVNRAALLVGQSPAGVVKERIENIREEILFVLGQVLANGILQPEDLAELAGKPA